MFIIRPITQDDHQGLMDLLTDAGHGLTSLPKDEKIIKEKIIQSTRSFKYRAEKPNGENYLFIMEDIFTGKLVGVSGIISKIGGFQAYYFYRMKKETMTSKMLKVTKEVESLHFEKIHAGPAEICSLFLNPEFRNSQNGRLLSLSRFLFMAENRECFEEDIIAEMRGKVNENGHSPFWDAVGKKFMDIDFVQADYLTMRSKDFIDELLPKYPIVKDLLPQEAQDVIGEVHELTRPAKKILEQEGFVASGLVGIFEPGPVLKAKIDDIRAVKDSKVLTIKEVTDEVLDSPFYVISNSGDFDFIACLGKAIIDKNTVKITNVVASALNLKVKDKVRLVTLK